MLHKSGFYLNATSIEKFLSPVAAHLNQLSKLHYLPWTHFMQSGAAHPMLTTINSII
jgi:hypothetical protein